MENEKIRLNAAEQVALCNLEAAIKAMELAKPLTVKRLHMKGAKAMFNGVIGSLNRLMELLKADMPTEQRLAYTMNARTLKYWFKIAPPMRRFDDDGCWISLEGVDTILDAAREKCLVCTLDLQQQRKCPLAKAMNQVPVKNMDENASGCGYHSGLY